MQSREWGSRWQGHRLLMWLVCCLMLSLANANTTPHADDATRVLADTVINPQHEQHSTPLTKNPAAHKDSTLKETSTKALQEPPLPALEQPVIDQAQLLTAAEKQQLSAQIQQIYQAGKGQIGLVIVPSTGQLDVFSYAMQLAEKWQLGSAKLDNGLLMLVSVNDHRIQILTGYGLEGIIPDIVAHRIIQDHIAPYFKRAQYAQGLQAGITEIESILSLDPELAKQAADSLTQQHANMAAEQSSTNQFLAIVMFILALGVIASKFLGRKLASLIAAVAGILWGFISGLGITASIVLGGAIFFLLISSIAQLIFQAFFHAGGGSGRGGGRSGGGYGGGGGGFGGGGASGSW